MTDELIVDYQTELIEDHHSPGSGRYGLRLRLPADISTCFPYLNAVMAETQYDHENGILIGIANRRRLAFRRHEIQLGMIPQLSDAPSIAAEVVDFVNGIWRQRDGITPSLAERSLPPVYEIYRKLPKTNCRQCGCSTCLAFAAELRGGKAKLESCLPLSGDENERTREEVMHLFGADRTG